MKVLALFMMLCIALISIVPANSLAMQGGANPTCCKQMGKETSCGHSQKENGTKAMCLARMCCNVGGFTTIAPLTIDAVLPLPETQNIKPYEMGDIIDFSASCWHPPKSL